MSISSLRCCSKFYKLLAPRCKRESFTKQLNLINAPRFGTIGMSMCSTMPAASPIVNKQKFDYFFVLDFESTCDRTPLTPQEIIEFPCLKVNGKTFEVEATFHEYVQPRVHGTLTSFCTELTGIIQDMVDGRPDIEVTLKMFDDWLRKEGALNDDVKMTFVTCGDWDLNIMLPNECQYFKLPVPPYMMSWINIKKPFVNVTGKWPTGLLHMMSIVNLKHRGRLHSGIDDCNNLALVLKTLAERGYVFDITGQRDC